MGVFEDNLYDWKAREEHAGALFLLQDHQLLKCAGLWRPTLLQRVDDWPMDGSCSELWACVSLNFKLLADMADETENRARFQLRRLTEMRLI